MSGDYIVIDLNQVSYLDHFGVAILAAATEKAKDKEVYIALLSSNKQAAFVLKILRVKWIPVFTSRNKLDDLIAASKALSAESQAEAGTKTKVTATRCRRG
ncbi:MAG: STAS domain-containing protein [Patescibacteria group bacterium]|jgi:anti-anti-sigma regulatory factor